MRNNYADKDAQPTLVYDSEASNTDVVITIAADADEFWCLDWIAWSYNGVPTGGSLLVEIAGVAKFAVDITAAGPGMLEFSRALYTGTVNQAVVITLSAGGSGVTGNLNVRYR